MNAIETGRPATIRTEHFVTLFDHKFLPYGVALYSSLGEHVPDFVLWILCMDAEVEDSLKRLELPNVRLIPLREVETEGLRAVKAGRSRGEYCWTLTPFTPSFVFARDPGVERVTYLDADLFFFSSPKPLFDEFEASGAQVLITDHGFAPEYDTSEKYGKYCVQFMTFRNSPGGRRVLDWWQARCLEWCFDRVEEGKFGDQKYLDDWSVRFAQEVHVLAQKELALAPWNARMFLEGKGEARTPTFFHFHRFRIVTPNQMMVYRGYRVGMEAERLYERYVERMTEALSLLAKVGIPVPVLPLGRNALERAKRLILFLMRSIRFHPFQLDPGTTALPPRKD
ncbi:glycosyl transferase [Geothrix rubra]|uniref:Glycosyl transferase n=1 Tax=Geothrix rubra TaxID=2927977 RepID=A0ABQ5Q8A4_9BACT|nr:hypothetical protein [Geothrix rubra]GLH70663.1 glycosyl transferase [Geothrix rubra]